MCCDLNFIKYTLDPKSAIAYKVFILFIHIKTFLAYNFLNFKQGVASG